VRHTAGIVSPCAGGGVSFVQKCFKEGAQRPRVPTIQISHLDVPPLRRYTVGRKDCTVIIADDASISRVHADIVVKPLPLEFLTNPSKAARVLVKDLSKFGTRVDGERVDKELPEGAEVATAGRRAHNVLVFGCKQPAATTMRLALEPMVLCVCDGGTAAGARGGAARALSDGDLDDASKAGVHVTKSWSAACTHLLVPTAPAADAVPLARKAAFVVSGKPAVSLDFLRAVRARRDPAAPMPDPADHPPAGGESWMTQRLSAAERSARGALLAGLTFVYRRPLGEEEDAVASGGGRRSSTVGGPSMDNLKALCASADEETRCAVAAAGGALAEMCDDRGGVAKRGALGDASVGAPAHVDSP
jgi:hypothetical protein